VIPPCLCQLSPGLCRGAKGQEGKETPSDHGDVPAAPPAPAGLPGASAAPAGCDGGGEMGTADLSGLQHQLWRDREDAHPAWGYPGCCVGLPEHPWPPLPSTARRLRHAWLAAQPRAKQDQLFSRFANCVRRQGVIL